MIGSYAQLTTDVWPFLAETQFLIESEDDGMWSLCDFFRGPASDGSIVTCEWKECELIENSEYKGIILKDDFEPYCREEQSWEYTNYP